MARKASRKEGAKTYTVQQGETLWSIAKMMTKQGKRWVDLVPVNGDELGKHTYVKAGTELVLPDGFEDQGGFDPSANRP